MRLTIALFFFAAAAQPQPERFDLIVREDIFAGFLSNDMERFERGMKKCDERLAQDAKHTDALAWKGGGTLYRSIRSFESGDTQRGNELWDQAFQLFEGALALNPQSVGTLATYGGSLVVFVRRAPAERQQGMMTKAAALYEKMREMQAPFFDKMGVHHRGETLGGLADIYQRLGQPEKSQEYLKRIVATMEGTPYYPKARKWLENPNAISPKDSLACLSCHVRQ
jgi:tetratricopeptide (TPR) repeat protein